MKVPNFMCLGVTKSGTTSLYDILIQHPENIVSVYMHNSMLTKNVNDVVKSGEVIGVVGKCQNMPKFDLSKIIILQIFLLSVPSLLTASLPGHSFQPLRLPFSLLSPLLLQAWPSWHQTLF